MFNMNQAAELKGGWMESRVQEDLKLHTDVVEAQTRNVSI